MYIFMKVFFKTNIFVLFSHLKLNNLKVIHDLYSQYFDLGLVQNDFNFRYEGFLFCWIVLI